MRRQNRTRLSLTRPTALAAAALASLMVFIAGAVSQEVIPRLTGAAAPMEDVAAPALATPITDDVRRMRNYPEQPPIIPHSIEGYQISLATNRCLECHRRQFTDLVGAPMISFTHFMDRNGQMLADVAPRRYFCTACHVQQTDAPALVDNDFRDMLTLSPVEED